MACNSYQKNSVNVCTCSHFVAVGQLLDLVGSEAEPEDGLGDEGVVEPLQLIVRHVEPLEVVLAHQQPVDVLQLVVVQSQGLQIKITFKN